MIIRRVHYSTLILIEILILIKSISTCPIPFDIQSKCRCAITETGRVYIYCARKQLNVIPHFNNSNIIFDELVLSGNRISSVKKNSFNGLKLRKLEFQSNPVVSIEPNAFIDLANYLEEFVFSTTVLSSNLETSSFYRILSELPNLKRLQLRSFDLSDAFNNSTEKTISPAKKLTQLSLQSCLITKIENTELFVHLFSNVERLDLSENRFEYFNMPLVLSLKKLKVLVLSKNRIRHLNIHPSISSMSFHPSNSLIELDLSYNGIETIDEHIFELISSQLEVLNLRNNELVTEKHLTFLIHLYYLREFYFDYNRLEAINQLYLPLNLKILSLKNNRLNHINLSILTRLGHLEKLYLSSNKLSQWSSTINNIFPSLETLELDRNQLASISSLNAPKLKQINLDGNRLGNRIDRKIFSNLPSLERVQLRDNSIETIDSQTFRNNRLQSLDLTNNSLTVFPLFANLNETLQTLSLRRNQLCTIDFNGLQSYRALNRLELDQNPLHCDCRLNLASETILRSKIQITGQCQTPIERRNFNVIDLPYEQLPCSSQTSTQCLYLTKIEPQTTSTMQMTQKTITTTTMTTTLKTNLIEIFRLTNSSDSEESTSLPISNTMELPLNAIHLSEFILKVSDDHSKVFIEWDLYPSLIDQFVDQDSRRNFFKRHNIFGFKISSSSPALTSDILDVLTRNYTLENVEQGEICLYILRKINYEKYCKQYVVSSTVPTVERVKSSITIDRKEDQTSWYISEPSKSVLIGSAFGIVLVLFILILVILFMTRCPYLLNCQYRTSNYHHNNDSKSEILLVRPTPPNTIPWSPPVTSFATMPHPYYPSHTQTMRPPSYQPSVSTQCTCPTHYHSSNSSSSDTSTHENPGLNYHIYQEILNDETNTANMSHPYRMCRSLHIETNSPPTSLPTNTTNNSEQCQHCPLSVLV